MECIFVYLSISSSTSTSTIIFLVLISRYHFHLLSVIFRKTIHHQHHHHHSLQLKKYVEVVGLPFYNILPLFFVITRLMISVLFLNYFLLSIFFLCLRDFLGIVLFMSQCNIFSHFYSIDWLIISVMMRKKILGKR